MLLAIAASFYLYRSFKKEKPDLNLNIPVSVDYKKSFEDSFKINLPSDGKYIELKDVNGGNMSGLLTESEILVNADDPNVGSFYQAWIVDSNEKYYSLGKLYKAKGGWITEYNNEYIENKAKMVVSLEKKFDDLVEKIVLVGSF